MKTEKIIDIKNLQKIYSRKTPFEHEALKDLNLEINRGEFLAIIGETGSGKSSLITHINALTKPTNGELEVFDYKITNSRKKIKNVKGLRKKIGMVFQFPEYQLFEDTVIKDVMFGPTNFGVKKDEAREISLKYLKKLKVPSDAFERSPFDLSGGQKRKVALAGILAIETEVLIFDEPTAGLDPESEREVLELCKKLNKEGRTIIFVTHNMENVLKYSSTVAVIKDKKILIKDTPQNIFGNYQLIKEANLSLPNIYSFLEKLNKTDTVLGNIRTKDDLVKVILKPKVKNKKTKKTGDKK